MVSFSLTHPHTLLPAFIQSYLAFKAQLVSSSQRYLRSKRAAHIQCWLTFYQTCSRLHTLPLAMLILSMHSLNALTCSGVSSDSSIVARRALRERSISFLVNRKQITLTQRGENLLRPIALVIRSFMRCLLTASGGDFKLAYNTRGEDLCDYFAIEISKGRFT